MLFRSPLKVVIDNYPESQIEEFDAANHPQKQQGSNLSDTGHCNARYRE